MVYISSRMNSYSVDHFIYPKIDDIANLVAIALVPKTDFMIKNAEYESSFSNKAFRIFDIRL
mgnify:CR=1 FL=1